MSTALPDEALTALREKLDGVDDRLIACLADRLDVCVEIAHVKKTTGIPMMQPGRVQHVKDRCAALARQRGVSGELVTQLYALIIEETCRLEDEIIGERG